MTGDEDIDAPKAIVEPNTPPQPPEEQKQAIEPRTDAQNKHIYALIKELETTKDEVDAWTMKLYKKRVSELSKNEANKIIEVMKKKVASKEVAPKEVTPEKEDGWVDPILPGEQEKETQAAKLMREGQEKAQDDRK